MATAKERHYWAHLRAALSAGQWTAAYPAKAPNGVALSWPELIRKFNKHCKGFTHIAEVAAQTQVLASLLSTGMDDEDVHGNTLRPPLDLGDECLVPRSQVEAASVGYEALRNLEPSNSSNFALAYYAYALDKPSESLEYLSKVPDPVLLVPNPDPPITSSASHASSAVTSHSILPEINDGRAWALTESFRGICLQGMSYEKLYPSDPRRALRAYLTSLPLFTILTSSSFTILSSTTSNQPSTATTTTMQPSNGKLDFTPFLQSRELWRWVERLLWRAVVLSAQLCQVHQQRNESSTTTIDANESFWTWFGYYKICSSAWPASFRTAHRSTVITIFLQAFVLRYRSHTLSFSSSSNWLHDARFLVQDYRVILASSTKFPKAGERNIKVEDFVDLCVAVWEVGSGGNGERNGWVIEMLWWATRYTFNSPKIYRHMIRLFHLGGDTPLAIRTLKLYVQIVSKSYQASSSGAHEQDIDSDVNWVETLVFGVRMICRYVVGNTGSDTEVHDDDDELLEYAGTLFEKARSRLDKEKKILVASVWLAEGIWFSVLALKEEDPYTRPERLRSARRCLIESIQIQPTSSGYYHLALALIRSTSSLSLPSSSSSSSSPPSSSIAEKQDLIQQAIESAGMALESDPKEIRFWHLLGLLLSIQQKWNDAKEVLERGADLDEEFEEEEGNSEDGEEEEEDDDNDETDSPRASHLTANTTDAPRPQHLPRPPVYVLSPNPTSIPPSSLLLKSTLEKTQSSKRELYEYSLQLRMTYNALMEVMDGPEGVEEKWVDVFGWIAKKKGVVNNTTVASEHSHRHSIDSSGLLPQTSRNSMDEKTTTVTQTQIEIRVTDVGEAVLPPVRVPLSESGDGGGQEDEGHHHQLDGHVSPIPITISPATPDSEFVQEGNMTSPENVLSSFGNGESNGLHAGASKTNVLWDKRSLSVDRGGGGGGGNKKVQQVQQMLKERVHKGRAGISAVSKKIGHGVVVGGGIKQQQQHQPHQHGSGGRRGRGLMRMRRPNSSPDFHQVIRSASFQASSIHSHSRRRIGSILHVNNDHRSPTSPPLSPSPSSPSALPPVSATSTTGSIVGGGGENTKTSSTVSPELKKPRGREAKEIRMLSDLWLMSAATFRRLGKIEQAKGAIQEAEVRDEDNPNVWIQLGLYYLALGHRQHAIDALHKALMIDTDNVAATVHLSGIYLTMGMMVGKEEGGAKSSLNTQEAKSDSSASTTTATDRPQQQRRPSFTQPPPQFVTSDPPHVHQSSTPSCQESPCYSSCFDTNVDLAAGLLSHLTKGKGWDVPEAWYYLAKAYKVQGRKEEEREALIRALELQEGRGVRDLGSALGWCI
ncbi:hypothetical protein AGABI2DRAFT_123023 [Agaricus bisporus var. bisporus H97]|uniref:hypothetical protein n=1 Tax=Agaricus bisporus var. bisporus (strain H97 / ATCC MYA-4626 / FGSC 10389) TaxID=936046 RepID=UPI00029F6CBC|nr:hypothetical protein AGABI2DRAFT_123023 [Agaricus bisporus var. bisporus H97]EKV42301.1 hypothetical protein AGABI2DRAFT_123023 [Agaricus bisporus var. bisporus H97]